jgi:hypothetical protein
MRPLGRLAAFAVDALQQQARAASSLGASCSGSGHGAQLWSLPAAVGARRSSSWMPPTRGFASGGPGSLIVHESAVNVSARR